MKYCHVQTSNNAFCYHRHVNFEAEAGGVTTLKPKVITRF